MMGRCSTAVEAMTAAAMTTEAEVDSMTAEGLVATMGVAGSDR
jgi:hypothetical protein